jgi:hypothetical protein
MFFQSWKFVKRASVGLLIVLGLCYVSRLMLSVTVALITDHIAQLAALTVIAAGCVYEFLRRRLEH